MKKRSLIALSVVVVLGMSMGGVTWSAETPRVAAEALPAGQDRVMVPVEGMTCGGCVESITRQVKKLEGVVDVEVDHLKGAVTVVRVIDKVTVEQIVETINKTGFKASKPKQS